MHKSGFQVALESIDDQQKSVPRGGLWLCLELESLHFVSGLLTVGMWQSDYQWSTYLHNSEKVNENDYVM